MTLEDYAHAEILVDRSGSMGTIADDMVGAIRSFITEQRAVPGKMTVSYNTFDVGPVDQAFSFLDINDDSILDQVRLRPRGMTALLDAQATTIISLGQKLDALPEDERPSKVLFVTVTDGGENSSREYDGAAVTKLVAEHTDQFAWEFAYFGANQDAFGEGAKMGVRATGTANYAATPDGVAAMASNLTSSTTAYRGGKGFTLSDDEE